MRRYFAVLLIALFAVLPVQAARVQISGVPATITILTILDDDPTILFNTATSGDTDFWLGVVEDGGGDDTDTLKVGKGLVTGTTPFFTWNKDGGFTAQNLTDAVAGYVFYDDDAGKPVLSIDTVSNLVGIGIATPVAKLHIEASDDHLRLHGPGVTIVADDLLGILNFTGTETEGGGATDEIGASIRARAAGTWTDNVSPSKLEFLTTPLASDVPVLRMTVDDTGDITTTGGTIYTPSSAQVIDAAGDTILANATLIVLNPDADYILTSTPTIADGTTGDRLLVTCANAEANTVTLQDEALLGSSNLSLKAGTTTVIGGKAIEFIFDGTKWVETGSQDIGTFQAMIFAPDGVNDEIPVYHVDTEKYPRGIIMMNVQITIPADAAYSMVFEEWAGDPPAAQADIETVTTGGSDSYMEVRTTDIDNRVIDTDDYIFLDIPATDVDWILAAGFFYAK